MSADTAAAKAAVTAAEFKQKLDEGTRLVVLDVRNPVSFAASKMDASSRVAVHNTPFSEMMREPGADDFVAALKSYVERQLQDVLPKGDTEDEAVVVVCATGHSSVPVVAGLRRLGYPALNLQGGMAAWNDFYDVRAYDGADGTKIFQISRPARGCLSYMVAAGDEAVVIDPLRHEDVYVNTAREHGLRVVRVLDTHGHADHISGGPGLARTLKAPYNLHPYDAIHPIDVLPATLDYEPVQDGQIFSFGPKDADGRQASLRALHVPGHTLGQVAFVLNESHAFVGDTVFVESIARPDLGGRGDTWAPIHYESLRRLIELPGETIFWPGHYSSPDEADADGLFGRTVDELLETNSGLQRVLQGKDAFIRFILGNLPEFPPQYVDIKRVNAGLLHPDGETAAALETGRNICALTEAYGA